MLAVSFQVAPSSWALLSVPLVELQLLPLLVLSLPRAGSSGPGGPGAISGMLAQCGAITAMLNAGTSRVSNGLHFGFHYATDLGLTKLGRHQVCSNVSRCFNAQLA